MCFTFLTLHEVETSVCLFVCFDFMLLFYLHFFTFQLCICTTAHSNTAKIKNSHAAYMIKKKRNLENTDNSSVAAFNSKSRLKWVSLGQLGMAYFDRMELLDVHHVVRHTLHVWALKPIYRPWSNACVDKYKQNERHSFCPDMIWPLTEAVIIMNSVDHCRVMLIMAWTAASNNNIRLVLYI